MTIAAFFDMDHTILNESSGMLLVRYLRQTGRIGLREGLRIGWWYLWYLLKLIEFPQAMMRAGSMSLSKPMKLTWSNTPTKLSSLRESKKPA